MDLALINLPGPPQVHPSVGLGYLAAVLVRAGHRLRRFDPPFTPLSWARFTDDLARRPPELLAVSATSFSSPAALHALVSRVARRNPRVKVLLGGPLGTYLGARVITEHQLPVDYVFRGEAELALPQILGWIAGGERGPAPAGLEQPGGGPATAPVWPEELDRLPFPRYPRRARLPVYPLVTSRGCNHRCSFCLSPTISGPRVRLRSAENVLAEITHAHGRHGLRQLHIVDDNFTADRQRACRILEGIIAAPFRVSIELSGGIRGCAIDAELARLLRRAGVRRASVGVESLEPAVFNRLGKGERLSQVLRGIQLLQQQGIQVHGFMIIGLPGSTPAVEQACLRRARQLGLRTSWLNALAFPGTRLHRWATQHGRVLDDAVVGRELHWSPDHVSFETDDFSAAQRRDVFIRANLAARWFDFILPGGSRLSRLRRGVLTCLRHDPSALPHLLRWSLARTASGLRVGRPWAALRRKEH